jgi:hypothetical protein
MIELQIKIINLNSATDEALAHNSSDKVKSAESISDCLRKLCDENYDEFEFSHSSVPPEAPDLICAFKIHIYIY